MYIPHKCRRCKYLFISNSKIYQENGDYGKVLFCMSQKKKITKKLAEECNYRKISNYKFNWKKLLK